jgi:hypothetical protein
MENEMQKKVQTHSGEMAQKKIWKWKRRRVNNNYSITWVKICAVFCAISHAFELNLRLWHTNERTNEEQKKIVTCVCKFMKLQAFSECKLKTAWSDKKSSPAKTLLVLGEKKTRKKFQWSKNCFLENKFLKHNSMTLMN